MEILHIKKDDMLYYEQKSVDNIYFIISGIFESSKKMVRWETKGKCEMLDIDQVRMPLL